jgi:hypothetical protein
VRSITGWRFPPLFPSLEPASQAWQGSARQIEGPRRSQSIAHRAVRMKVGSGGTCMLVEAFWETTLPSAYALLAVSTAAFAGGNSFDFRPVDGGGPVHVTG